MLDLLVVEDDEKTRDILSRFLRAKGYLVREAKDGQEAVQAVCEKSFDLIVMDVKMPRLDGLSAFQEIRRTSPSSPVLLITGYRIHEDLERLLQRGAVECLCKPFTFDELAAAIERLIVKGAKQSEQPDSG